MIRYVGIMGFGTMGIGISLFFLSNNIKVHVWERDRRVLHKGMNKFLKKAKEVKVTTRQIKKYLMVSSELKEMRDCDLIIETVVEDKKIKKSLFKQLKKKEFRNTIVATNTSSISISELARSYHNPKKFVGMHFMNPAYQLPLVEIVRGKKTSNPTIKTVQAFLEKYGKKTFVVNDAPGFVVNNMLIPLINDAAKLLDKNVAGQEDIDKMMELLGFPLGPFFLADYIGLDVCISILKKLKIKPAKCLVQHVRKGHIGKKKRKGFYHYK